ncbi:hypothetical protein FRB96_007756 [Tulasnella sp. 330]|nr:hypothetical protein FRB96_007756 [Tulasnella sp. 330]KAG8881686.1 hypothetical protein FRB97_009235 [Tulasnella sp. 331]
MSTNVQPGASMGVLQNDEHLMIKNSYSNVNAAAEDREAARSEDLGTIPQKEIEDLGGDANILDNNIGVTTRGVKNDAMKGDRDVDEAVNNATAFDEETGGQNRELMDGGKHTI